MRLFHLSLTNFRNYSRLELSLPTGPVLLHGANAQGKTSILEAIYYLATSRSPWTVTDKQLVNWRALDDIIPYTKISAEVENARRPLTKIDITLVKETTGGDGFDSGDSRTDSRGENGRFRKEIRVNGVTRRAMELLGEMNVVMFLPQDLAIIEGSPADRRRYLNITLSQVDQTYVRALHTYEKALAQRNALLRRIDKRQAGPTELAFWDNQLVTSGSVVIAGRQRLLRDLEGLAQQVHHDLTANAETLELQYQPNFTPTAKSNGQLSFNVYGLDLHRQMEPDEIEPQLRAALAERQREEIQRGLTLVGPQRDELRFIVNGYDLSLYGSRGQARTAVMAIKLAELSWMRGVTGEWPVLLLDEFIAELDTARRAYLLDRIDGATQALLTTTEPDIFTKDFLSRATVFKVHAGQVAG